MRFVLDIECDNAAFGDDMDFETSKILHKAASDVELGYESFPKIYDSNGNAVGWAGFIKGASYNDLKGALVDLLNDYEEGLEIDPPESVIQARKLLGRA